MNRIGIRRRAVFLLLATGAVGIALGLWFGIFRTAEVDANTAVANACISPTEAQPVDVDGEIIVTDDGVTTRTRIASSASQGNQHQKFYDAEGVLEVEKFLFVDRRYTRERNAQGVWGEWELELGRLAPSPLFDTAGGFCNVADLENIRDLGQETLDDPVTVRRYAAESTSESILAGTA